MSSRSGHDLLYHFLAPAFLIFTPFISFVTYNAYSYTAPEIWICLAGLTSVALLCGVVGLVGGWPARVLLIAALLVLWVDLQFDWWDEPNSWRELRIIGVFVLALILSFAMRRHLSRIVTAVFATMLMSTVVLASVDRAVSRDWSRATATEPSQPVPPQLPILVHLVLDEHIGIEGIPEDVPHGREMRELLQAFFKTHSFRVFARAYSHYVNTHNSLANLVNFSSAPVDGAFISGASSYDLHSNKYFELLGRAGYNIHVYQSDHMDFCVTSREYIVKCAYRDITGIKGIESGDMPVSDKVRLIYRRFADLSALKTAVHSRYLRMREALRSAGWTLPEWRFNEGWLGPLRELRVLEDVTADVARASPGDMFFVYLAIPHSPYMYDPTCALRPVREWELSRNRGPTPPNDRESRARRYGLYLEQMRCLYRKLDAMFQAWQKAAIFDRLVIILHGDHGSRIYERDPEAKNEQKLSHSDYVDGFSALFAVKGPRHPAGYDRRVAAIEQLLGEVIGEETGDDPAHVEQIPYVFLSDGPNKPMLRQPLPAFGDKG